MKMSDSEGLEMGNSMGKVRRLARVEVEVRHSPQRGGVIKPVRGLPVVLSEPGGSFEISGRSYVNDLRQRPGKIEPLTVKGVE
jgi:hypothetical protein